MIAYLIQGLTLGFAAAVQPGPFQAYLISQVFSQGWRKTLLASLGPLVSDGPIVLLVLFVLNQVPGWFQRLLSLGGGFFILYLAMKAYQQWQRMRSQTHDTPLKTGPAGNRASLWRAAMMNALSPGPYLFWSLVTGPILLRGWAETPANGLSFLLGFYGTMVSSLVAIILLFGTTQRLGNRVRVVLLGLSVLALGGFGLYQVWVGLSGF